MSSIYFLGIGGTAMASVAVALSHSGHAVSVQTLSSIRR